MKYIISTILLLLFPVTAFAQSVPEKPVERISWAMKLCGPMPEKMFLGLFVLAVLLIIAIILMKGNKK